MKWLRKNVLLNMLGDSPEKGNKKYLSFRRYPKIFRRNNLFEKLYLQKSYIIQYPLQLGRQGSSLRAQTVEETRTSENDLILPTQSILVLTRDIRTSN